MPLKRLPGFQGSRRGSTGARGGAPRLAATLTTDRPGNKVAAGDTIKITGVAFSLPQQALHLTEMVPIRQAIRFRDLGVYE